MLCSRVRRGPGVFWAWSCTVEGVFIFSFTGHLEGSLGGLNPWALLLPATLGKEEWKPSAMTSAHEPGAGPMAPHSHSLLVSGLQSGLTYFNLDKIFWDLFVFVFYSPLLYI